MSTTCQRIGAGTATWSPCVVASAVRRSSRSWTSWSRFPALNARTLGLSGQFASKRCSITLPHKSRLSWHRSVLRSAKYVAAIFMRKTRLSRGNYFPRSFLIFNRNFGIFGPYVWHVAVKFNRCCQCDFSNSADWDGVFPRGFMSQST
jgi:hypothetical protein